MIDKLDSYGQFTYRGAWALEIVAASMGLLTAIILGMQAYQESQNAVPLDAVLMAIPFVMVAFAELTKIPIATLLFVAPIIYKPFAAIALFLLALITFETVVGGLDTALSQRQAKFRNIENKILEVESKIAALRSTTSSDASAATLDNIKQQIVELETARQNEIERFETQIKDVKNSSISIEAQTQINLYDAEIKRVDSEITDLQAAIEADEARDQSKFQDQQLSFTNQIKVYTEAGDKNAARKIQQKLDALPNPANKKPWKDRRREYENKVNELEASKADYVAKREDIFANITVSDDVANELVRLQTARDDTLTKLSVRIQDLYRQKADFAQSQFDKLDQQTQNLREAEVLEQQLIQLQSEKVSIANQNQIRRFAATAYGVSPADVTDKQEQTATKVYVYSLAGLAALAGPITAIVALALQTIAARERRRLENGHKKTIREKFWISLRKYFVSGKHKRRKTVIQEVQVEVEKEVEKIVEVPVTEKEFIYIPLLTNSPDEMMEELQKKLPKEVFERIKVGVNNE